MKEGSKRDPLLALENQDARQRQDLVKAARFVVNRLSGDELRAFVVQATGLLRRFAPKADTEGGACQTACPKEISIDFIAFLNRELLTATLLG